MKHVIRKQIIELRLQKSLDPFQIQHKISRDYWEIVLGSLTKAFDQFASEDEVINLDRLEIDLGIIENKSVIESSWTEGIFNSALLALRDRLDLDPSGSEQLKASVDLNIFQQWLFYLEHGYFPWNTTEITEDWEGRIAKTLRSSEEQRKTFINKVKNSPQIALRIVMQHNQQFLLQILEVLRIKKPFEVVDIVDKISRSLAGDLRISSSGSHGDVRKLRTKIWYLILCATVEYPVFISPIQFISALQNGKRTLFLAEAVPEPLTQLLIAILPEIELLLRSLQIFMPNSVAAEEKIEEFKKRKSKGKAANELPPEHRKNQRKTGKEIYNEKKSPGPLQKTNLNKLPVYDIDTRSFAEVIDQEGIFVTNAGIVLLHPFLPMFYEYMEFLQKQEFKNTELRQKAVNLLHYLATGVDTPPEFELTIAKILCELPYNMPMDMDIEIGEEDIEECEILLSTVIEKWEVLKGASIAALREDFLQRGGHLFKKNNQLHLRIEQRSIDILLDHLPWMISMVKLPWMNDVLYVEWR